MRYIIPDELISREHIQIYSVDNIVHIDLSDEIKNELAKWSKQRADDILDDMRISAAYAGMFQYANIGLKKIYNAVFCTLHQVY